MPRRFRLPLALALLAAASTVASGLAAGTAPDDPATPAAGTRVIESRPYEIPGRLLALSPDGRWILGHDGGELCVYGAATLARSACGGANGARLDLDGVVWSPDGTRVAFTEDGLEFLIESDIWVLDVATGETTNLSDDRADGDVFFAVPENGEPGPAAASPVHWDLRPAWSPDGRTIAFARSSRRGEEYAGTEIVRIPAAGGEATGIVAVSPDVPFAVSQGLAWMPDGASLLYAVGMPDAGHPDNGIWSVRADGSGKRRILGLEDRATGSAGLLQIAATGRHALVSFFGTDLQLFEAVPFALLDLESGRAEPLGRVDPGSASPRFSAPVTFSPDGTELLYGVTGAEPGPNRVVARTLATSAETTLLDGVRPIWIPTNRGVNWASDGTVLVATGYSPGLLLRLAPDAAAPAAPATPATFLRPQGTTATINDAIVAVRAAPSADAPVVLELAQGTTVGVLGPPTEGDGFAWVPIADPTTGTLGYVRAEFLTTATEP